MTEIDEAMINRAAVQLGHGSPHNREDVRRALEAALNPKPEPEIEVSEGMHKAGYEAAGGFYAISEATVEYIYRAMESTRLKEAEKADQRLGPKDRRSEYKHTRHTRRLGSRFGRRSTDKTPYDELPFEKAQEGAAYAAKPAPQVDYGDAAVQTKTGQVECDLGGGVNAGAPVCTNAAGVGCHRMHSRDGDHEYGGPRYTPHRRKDDPK